MRRLLFLPALVAATSLGGCISEARIAKAGTRVDLGIAYLNEKRPEAAVATLREAVKLDPRNWRARAALAMAYAAKGEPELADESFQKALRINPGEGEILVNYGAFLVAHARAADAVPVLEKAREDLDYRNPAMVLSNLSLAYLESGNPEQAVVHAREAVKRVPGLCPAWYHLGLAEEARGQVDAALAAYDTLTQTCPDEAIGGWLRAGCLMAHRGDSIGADIALSHVVGHAAGTPLADEARACLAQVGG
ncbi:MAG: tetratricopeptide repeat protein [Deltaproteobacteria bacterium]|nr:tetratricopeptide repeat protein [Deltaproteobacteria bacterium]